MAGDAAITRNGFGGVGFGGNGFGGGGDIGYLSCTRLAFVGHERERFMSEFRSDVTLTVNGRAVTANVEDRTLLIHFLREQLRLTGSHVGCDTSNCGACTTIEGITGPFDGRSAVQEGFRQCHGLQCGYCTPGMVMAATALLAENPSPNSHEIRHALEGNICRCTGYQMIVDSIEWAAANPSPSAGGGS